MRIKYQGKLTPSGLSQEVARLAGDLQGAGVSELRGINLYFHPFAEGERLVFREDSVVIETIVVAEDDTVPPARPPRATTRGEHKLRSARRTGGHG